MPQNTSIDDPDIPTQQAHHCMVVHAFYPLAETRVQRQAETLVSHGYDVDVICIRHQADKSDYEVVRGVHVHRLPVGRDVLLPGVAGRMAAYVLFMLWAMVKLNRLYAKKRHRVVQVHNLPDFLVFCAWWPKLRGARVILDIHDVMPEFYAENTGLSMTSWLVRLMIWQEQASCRFADHVITVTEPWRQALIGRGVPAEKTSVIMNVPDSALFHRGVQAEAAALKNGKFSLIYHGVQAPRHGLDTILRAVDRLRHDLPNLKVIIHGNGDAHDDLVRLSEQLGLSDWVEFSTRFMAIEELPLFIAQADMGVVPYHNNIFSGGILPTKVLEYVALGLPVIAARTPAIEAYFDDSMIELFEPGNVDELTAHIKTLYSSKARREDLVKQSDKFNQHYNWDAHSKDYVNLVRRLN
ncbi:MAG: glycosyltransferase family 4 protein [Anaerolineae bacterium]|nr:glycosyltransferase family 4 protein [Anaerolineae bacterium]